MRSILKNLVKETNHMTLNARDFHITSEKLLEGINTLPLSPIQATGKKLTEKKTTKL